MNISKTSPWESFLRHTPEKGSFIKSYFLRPVPCRRRRHLESPHARTHIIIELTCEAAFFGHPRDFDLVWRVLSWKAVVVKSVLCV